MWRAAVLLPAVLAVLLLALPEGTSTPPDCRPHHTLHSKPGAGTQAHNPSNSASNACTASLSSTPDAGAFALQELRFDTAVLGATLHGHVLYIFIADASTAAAGALARHQSLRSPATSFL